MSREKSQRKFRARKALGGAGTSNTYLSVGPRRFLVRGFTWFYESTEANADNTLDFLIRYTSDGSNFTNIFANGNANGLLDTAAVLAPINMMGNAAVAGQTAVDVSSSFEEITDNAANTIPAGAVLHIQLVTAGTGNVPAITMVVYGTYI